MKRHKEKVFLKQFPSFQGGEGRKGGGKGNDSKSKINWQRKQEEGSESGTGVERRDEKVKNQKQM